jgi:Domain of unknown function (DUF1876)/Domain of unknown function (DUF1918)
MKAHAGDRIILAPVTIDGPFRDGEVIEARGPDDSAPFLVRWSDGHSGLIYPGPGSVMRVGPAASPEGGAGATPNAGTAAAPPPSAARAGGRRRVHDWQVRVSIVESDDDTDAQVVLVADSPTHLTASGHSHRSQADSPTPQIGDEVAVARALRRLADQLLDTAAGDIAARSGHHDVTLTPR